MDNNNIRKCQLCKSFVRIKITSTNPLTIEEYGIVTTQFGGHFCGSNCALNYVLQIKKKKKAQIRKLKVECV
tara:strand:+ start:228 stop:443 length:216 start_codon:yes stop_codon:yes gene_type:complete